MVTRFESVHFRQYGYTAPDRDLVIEAVSVEAIGSNEQPRETSVENTGPKNSQKTAVAETSMCIAGVWQKVPIVCRSNMEAGQSVDGPAIISEETATTVIEPGWQAKLTESGDCILTRIVPRPKREAIGTKVDPVMLEVFNNLFMSIAEQMGVTLANTAYSVNIKERLDFSCAIFAPDGSLVANAPHVPVH